MSNLESTPAPKLIELPDFVKGPEAVQIEPVARLGEVQSYPPRAGTIELNLTAEQTAKKLADKQEHERQLAAASASVADAFKNSVDSNNTEQS